MCTFPNLQSDLGRLAEFGCVFIFYCTFLPFRDFAVWSPDSELADAAAAAAAALQQSILVYENINVIYDLIY